MTLYINDVLDMSTVYHLNVHTYSHMQSNNAITVPHSVAICRCCRTNKRKMQLHFTQRPVITVAKTLGNLLLTYK